jgi:hypothetical protein
MLIKQAKLYLLKKDYAYRFKNVSLQSSGLYSRKIDIIFPRYISKHRPQTAHNYTVQGRVYLG